jgi:hypothetical protein
VYSTCLFCNNSLGRNEILEQFPVGRRLAYDESRGRLWVVCRRCERWNLTPIETRWEAIEEAERLFRQARLRITTENIALVRLNEGLELVRIGTPPRLELAGWRYGDQFGKRRRKFFALSGLGVAASALPLLGSLGAGVAIIGGAASLAHVVVDRYLWRRDSSMPTIFITGNDGVVLRLAKHDAWSATLVPIHPSREWYLTVWHRVLNSTSATRESSTGRPGKDQARYAASLRGSAAQRALAVLLPYANPIGGSSRSIREAVGVIESSSNLDRLVYTAAATTSSSRVPVDANPLTRLPARVRLALEMVLHEDAEHRAMESELAELEQRWREAEEIAAIADSLLVSTETEARLAALRRAKL